MNWAVFSLDNLVLFPVFLLSFILLLSLIVFVHEFGHFKAARMLGVRVDVFSIGFGKVLAKWRDRHGTEWRISLLPLGGFVKFFGDAGPVSDPSKEVAAEQDGPATTQFPKPGHEEELARRLTPEERKVCFHFKPVWARSLIVAAGPISNFILAIAIFWGLIMSFGEVVVEPRIGAVSPESAAEEAGFAPGDVIVAADGRKVSSFDDLMMVTRLGSGEEITFTVERDGETMVILATPRRQVVEDAFGNKSRGGLLGLSPDRDAYKVVKHDPLTALGIAAERCWGVIESTVKFLSRLIAGKEDASNLGGPLKMAQYAGQAMTSGFDENGSSAGESLWEKVKVSLATFINLAAFVSVSIGFLNLLPVPVLDGGHLMYYAYEAAAGKPLGARAQAIGFRVGLLLLGSFMLFVTWNDIASFFSLKS
ncbi:MAG: RIP metalloprotease [Parvularculaceae bacterium]|nr:RIP metalloprotease [Parvularculaceae bacterium]